MTKAKIFKEKIPLYKEILVLGYIFADVNKELWCWDITRKRVLHINSEIIEVHTNKTHNNGYPAKTLSEAIQIVKKST